MTRTLTQRISDAKVRAVVSIVRTSNSLETYASKASPILELLPFQIEQAGKRKQRSFEIHHSYIPQGDFIYEGMQTVADEISLRVPIFRIRKRSFTEYLCEAIEGHGLRCRATYDSREGKKHHFLTVYY